MIHTNTILLAIGVGSFVIGEIVILLPIIVPMPACINPGYWGPPNPPPCKHPLDFMPNGLNNLWGYIIIGPTCQSIGAVLIGYVVYQQRRELQKINSQTHQ